VVIALLGLGGILRHPNVLAAVDPRHAITFLAQDGWGGFAVLGGVFLAITGGEALTDDFVMCTKVNSVAEIDAGPRCLCKGRARATACRRR
jgi:K+ transporter